MAHPQPDRFALREAATRALVDPVFVLDYEGRYLDAFGGNDRGAYDSLDYLIGKTFHELMPAALADHFLAEVRRVIDTRQPSVYEFPLSAEELAGNAKDGPQGQQWFQGRIAPIIAAGGDVPDCVAWAVINITQRKQLEAELHRLATTDTLTGLSSRRAFLIDVETAMREARAAAAPLAFAILDLDDFKGVNDRFGHVVGDAILQHVAMRLLDGAIPASQIGRIGGEEFAVLFTGVAVSEAIAALLAMQAACAARPFLLGGAAVPVSFSAGVVAMAEEDHQPSDLLRRADHWMYVAKNAGRGQVAYPGWIERRQR